MAINENEHPVFYLEEKTGEKKYTVVRNNSPYTLVGAHVAVFNAEKEIDSYSDILEYDYLRTLELKLKGIPLELKEEFEETFEHKKRDGTSPVYDMTEQEIDNFVSKNKKI